MFANCKHALISFEQLSRIISRYPSDYIYKSDPSPWISSVMANYFADRILYYSGNREVIDGLSPSEKVFIDVLKLALKRRNKEHRVRSGAAFLFWMYGISNLEDVRNAVTGILRAGKKKTERLTDHDDVTKKVIFSIDAIKETFANLNLYDDTKGESQTIEKDTKIAPRLLRQWSDRYSPLRQGPGSVNAAMVSLLYEPLASVRRWNNDESACKTYLSLLAKHYNINPAPTDLEPLPLLEYYVKRFKLSEEVEDEEVENDMTKEDTNETKKGSTAKVINRDTRNNSTAGTVHKGKNKSTSRKNGDHVNLQNLIGISYPAGRGYRTIVGITQDDRPESVPRSQWKRYLPEKSSKQERQDWLERYPDSKNKTETWEKPIEMSYERFCELQTGFLYRLVKSQTGTIIRVLATVGGKGQVIKVNEMSQEQYVELLKDVTVVDEGNYKPRKKRANEALERDESSDDDEER